MKAIQLKAQMAVRLPHWTHCVVEIEDVGCHSIWGILRDIRNDLVIQNHYIAPLDAGWVLALDSDTIIQHL